MCKPIHQRGQTGEAIHHGGYDKWGEFVVVDFDELCLAGGEQRAHALDEIGTRRSLHACKQMQENSAPSGNLAGSKCLGLDLLDETL